MKFVDIVRRSHIESFKSNIQSHGVDWIEVQADDKIGIQTVLKEVEGSIIFNVQGNTAIITAAVVKNPLKMSGHERIY